MHNVYNTQDLNRYSYVHNNPLSVVDMDGYGFFKKFWKMLVAIVVAVVFYYVAPVIFASAGVPGFTAGVAAGTPGYATIVSGVGMNAGAAALSAGVAGAASDAVTGGAKGALIGGLTGAAFSGVGSAFGHDVPAFGTDDFNWGNFAGRVAAHGAVGGLSSIASGGKFLSGFLSAGFSAAAGPIKIGGFAGGLVKSTMVGGIGSVLGGGKFANGAVTGAFQYTFNDSAGSFVESLMGMNASQLQGYARVKQVELQIEEAQREWLSKGVDGVFKGTGVTGEVSVTVTAGVGAATVEYDSKGLSYFGGTIGLTYVF